MTTLQQLVPAQVSAEVPVNENFDALSAAAIFSRRHPATSGLTWGYHGGLYNSAAIADGTLALTPSAANYIVVDRASGAVSASTADTNWTNTGTYGRLYKVTTGTASISAVEDHRFGASGIFASGAGAVSSVNGQTGAVTLDAGDVGADPAGTAAAAVAALVGTAPALLDTLGEISDALADNENFAAAMTAALAEKAPLASPALTGTPTAPTAAGGTNTTQLATTAFVQAAVAGGGYSSPLTTKGDLFARGAAADTRLPVGTNGQYLQADSAEPTGLKWASFSIVDDSVTYAKLQNVSATQRVLGRNSSGAGDPEEVTLSQLLDWIGSAAQGDILYRGASGWSRLAAGTAGQFLQTGGAGANPAWAAAGGGGLTNWTDAVNSAAPNATIPVTSLTATNAATNVDAVLGPKGAGAIAAQVSDNATAGGAKRGTYSTDWQRHRDSSSKVASGQYSTILGGRNNRAGGSYSCAMGIDSYADGSNAVAMGQNCSAAGNQSVSMGNLNAVSAGISSIALGDNCTVNQDYCVALGRYARAVRAEGMLSFASGQFAGAASVAQWTNWVLRRLTSDATATALTTNNGAAGNTNQLVLANNMIVSFTGSAVARDSSGNCKAWKLEGAIKRGANAAATALLGTPNVTELGADAGASAYTLALSADTTNGCLSVKGTGAAATQVYWVCNLHACEHQPS